MTVLICVNVPHSVCACPCVCPLWCKFGSACMLSGGTSTGHWLLLFEVEIFASLMFLRLWFSVHLRRTKVKGRRLFCAFTSVRGLFQYFFLFSQNLKKCAQVLSFWWTKLKQYLFFLFCQFYSIATWTGKVNILIKKNHNLPLVDEVELTTETVKEPLSRFSGLGGSGEAGWTGSTECTDRGSDLNRSNWSWCKTSESVQPRLSECFRFEQLQPHTLAVVFLLKWKPKLSLVIGDICESVFVGKTKDASNSRHIPDPNKFFRTRP